MADSLVAELHSCLDAEAFELLGALAVFPDARSGITMHVGGILEDATGNPWLSEQRFGLLAELPWMRYGRMPDWLRSRLVRSLGKDREREVRKFYFELLRSDHREGDGPALKVTPDREQAWLRTLSRYSRHATGLAFGLSVTAKDLAAVVAWILGSAFVLADPFRRTGPVPDYSSGNIRRFFASVPRTSAVLLGLASLLILSVSFTAVSALPAVESGAFRSNCSGVAHCQRIERRLWRCCPIARHGAEQPDRAGNRGRRICNWKDHGAHIRCTRRRSRALIITPAAGPA